MPGIRLRTGAAGIFVFPKRCYYEFSFSFDVRTRR